MDKVNYTYNGKFEGNILVVGWIGCGKTAFVQNLGKHKLFEGIKEVYWILKIELSTNRENNIRNCFKDQYVDFKYPNNFENFNNFQNKKNIREKNQIIAKII